MNKPTNYAHGAVIVTRVSTGEQVKHGTSLDSQKDACRQKALALSLPIVAEYEDGGISGAFLLMRPGMQAAIADIQAGRADTLICTNIDRYSRDREHQERIKKDVRAAGGRIVFCDMHFEDTPEGDLQFNIAGDFAVYERQRFRARAMEGKRKKVADGNQITRGVSPYGYHIPTKADVLRRDYPLEQLGRYILVPHRADTLRWVFEQYHSGALSLSEIVRTLNAEGVPTARGNGPWRVSAMAFMLTNPLYKGAPVAGRWQSRKDETRLLQTNKITGQPLTTSVSSWLAPPENWVPLEAPALVGEDVWDGVQRRLAQNRATRGGNPQRVRMLSGRVVCPQCGGGMECSASGGARGIKRAAYVCGRNRSARLNTGQTVCQRTRYPMAALEQAALLALVCACQQPEMIEAALTEYSQAQSAQAPPSDPRAALAAIGKALAEVASQEAAAIQAQIAGIRAGASPDAYAAVFADLAARRKDLEDARGVMSQALARSRGAKPSTARPTREDAFQRGLEDVHRALTSEHVPNDQKRKLIGTLIETVTPHADGADVCWLPGLFGSDTFQNMLTLQPRLMDSLIAESGLTVPQVSGILTLLEMKGLARRLPGNAFVRVL